MTYDKLLIKYQDEVKVKEMPLKYDIKGLYKNNKIIIDSNIDTDAERCCILSEELGHHFTSSGDIIDLKDIRSLKQEIRARNWAYEKQVGIVSLINAYEKGVRTKHELAEYLNVTEGFLIDAIEYYRNKYGTYYEINNYIIYFCPAFGVMKIF